MQKVLKSVVLAVIVFTAIVGLAGCDKAEDKATSKKTETADYKAYVVSSGSHEIGKTTKKVVSSTQELNNLYSELKFDQNMKKSFSKYNDKYFKDKSLAVLSVVLTNSSESINIKKAIKEENNVRIEYDIESTANKTGLTVMKKDFIVVEVDKDVTGIVYFSYVK